jgi:hypothetical protein
VGGNRHEPTPGFAVYQIQNCVVPQNCIMPHMSELIEPQVDHSTRRKWDSLKVQPPKFSSDDDLSLRVSMYLGSNEGSEGLVEDVTGLVRAYGFTNFVSMFRAPGSFYFSMNVEYHSKDEEEARHNKEELEKDLIKGVGKRSHKR